MLIQHERTNKTLTAFTVSMVIHGIYGDYLVIVRVLLPRRWGQGARCPILRAFAKGGMYTASQSAFNNPTHKLVIPTPPFTS